MLKNLGKAKVTRAPKNEENNKMPNVIVSNTSLSCVPTTWNFIE